MANSTGAARLNLKTAEFDGLLVGDTSIDRPLAELLERLTLIHSETWLGLERRYREGIAAGRKPMRG